jgi:hypothetical protein
MSTWDDGFYPIEVGGPPHYSAAIHGAVQSAPVLFDGEVEGYLVLGSDAEDDAATLLYRYGGKLEGAPWRYWYDRLLEMKSRGLPASVAVRSLLGESGPPGVGVIGGTLSPAAGKRELDEELNSGVKERRLRRETARRGASRPPRAPSREETDAALRGEADLTPAILTAIESIDSALALRPMPEPVVLTVWLPDGRVPDDLAPGDRVFEPTYLLGQASDPDRPPEWAAVHLALRIPESTPALYLEPESPLADPVFLLARGIEWEAVRILRDLTPAVVTARVVDVRPTRLGALPQRSAPQ